MGDHLFVYGTLMRTASGGLGGAERLRLAREAASLGRASMRGRLLDLGSYPGLSLSRPAGGIVHGELCLLADPARTFAWLDAYEGIAGGASEPEYERRQETARLVEGGRVTAWVYAYRGETTGARWIADGRWRSTSATV